jgi:hypothetical protein
VQCIQIFSTAPQPQHNYWASSRNLSNIKHPVEIFPTSSTFHVPDTLNVTASLLISTVITSLYSHVYLFCLYQWNEIRIGTSEWVIGNWKNIVTITESLL